MTRRLAVHALHGPYGPILWRAVASRAGVFGAAAAAALTSDDFGLDVERQVVTLRGEPIVSAAAVDAAAAPARAPADPRRPAGLSLASFVLGGGPRPAALDPGAARAAAAMVTGRRYAAPSGVCGLCRAADARPGHAHVCRAVPKALRDGAHHAVARAIARFAAGTALMTATWEAELSDGGRADVMVQGAQPCQLEIKTLSLGAASYAGRSWDALVGDAERRAWQRYGDAVRTIVIDVDSGVVSRGGRDVLAWLQELRDDLGPRDPLDAVPIAAAVGCALADAAAVEQRWYEAQLGRAGVTAPDPPDPPDPGPPGRAYVPPPAGSPGGLPPPPPPRGGPWGPPGRPPRSAWYRAPAPTMSH
jgi:hypothetical protein